MGKEFLYMQKLAGIITESQYKQLLEDQEVIDRILDKISSQGIGSLEPKEKEYLDKHSKGEKNIEAPIHYIKLNLPKDINSPEIISIWSQEVQDGEEEEKLTDIIDELIELNPQISPKLFENSYGLYNDVIDDVTEGTKKEILYSYFYWLFRGLVWDIDKYSEKEANERADKYADLADDFRDKAMQGQWMVVSGVTDNDHANLPNKKLIDPNHRDSNDLWGDLGA
jgi:hypothetical protein